MEYELLELIHFLASKKYVTIREIERAIHITRRQAKYRIDKLNTVLKEEGVSPIIFDVRGMEIPQETSTKISELLKRNGDSSPYYFSKKERIIYMYLMLFINQDYLLLNDFMDLLSVSRSTVLLDFKELNNTLEENGVSIKNNRSRGYFLEGSEMDIRYIMMKFVNSLLEKDKSSRLLDRFIDDYYFEIFDYSRCVIIELAKKYNIRFVGDRLSEFIYIFIFLKARIQSGVSCTEKINEIIDTNTMDDIKELLFTKDLLKNYKNTEFISKEDICYISAWVLGVSFGDINEDTKDCILISDLVGKIMTRFEMLTGTHYYNSQEIFIQLYAHFRPAYYRLLFHLPIYNPLCKKVKEEYNEMYKLVDETMKPFNAIFGTIPEEEVAYLTMHFASIFTYDKKEIESTPRKKALVVCSNGIGSSALLFNELNQMFPELIFLKPVEFSNYKSKKDEVDIIFATSYIVNQIDADVPVIRVSPIMDITERYQVIREVYMHIGAVGLKQSNIDIDKVLDIISKYATINQKNVLYDELLTYFTQVENLSTNDFNISLVDMLSEDTILLNVEADDWETAIRLAYEPMVKNKIITKNYVESTIRSVQLHGPYIVITKHVALPHTKSIQGALKLGIGIAVLKEPIAFGSRENDPVKYIFSLSALDNERHLSAMATLIEFFNNKEFFKMLDNAKSAREVIDYIKNK